MADDAFNYTVKLKRGDDTQKCKVSAPDIETLTQRVDAVREKLGEWAGDYNEIQPENDGRRIAEDQSDLSEVGTA